FSKGVNVLVGEMGSGKSSVLEAITFGLYGTTPSVRSRQVTLDELVRRVPSTADQATVKVGFTHDGTGYSVKRVVERGKGTTEAELRRHGGQPGRDTERSTASHHENGELVAGPRSGDVTEEVEELLGIDYDLFSRAIYSEQNELDYFLNLTPGDRKEKIDELLKLDRFETARTTLVTVTNRVEDRRRDRESELENLEEELEDAGKEELEEEIEETEEEIRGLEEEKEKIVEELEELEEEEERVSERKERHEELQQKKTALEARIETMEDRIGELEEEAGGYSGLGTDEIEEKKREVAEELEEFEETEEEIEELRSGVSVIEDRVERYREEVEELEEEAEKLGELEELEEELEGKKEEVEELRARQKELETRKEDALETIRNLSQAAEECPTCGQELTEEHRRDVIQDAKERKEEIEEELGEVEEELRDVEEELGKLEDRKEELSQYRDAEEELEEKKEELETEEEDLQEKKAVLEELEEEYSPGEKEELERAEGRLETAEELRELEEDREERVEELKEVEEELDDTGFDEEELEELREEINEREKRVEVIENNVENKEELLEERRKRLEDIKAKEQKLEDYRGKVEEYRVKKDRLNELLNALEETQMELRQEFVSSVNEVMDEVWDRVYPYDDYDTLRLNPEEGYAVELQDSEGNWVSVEGQVSGGERHSSALALRIALSIVLAPSWQVLILDEPTHNLDTATIEDLAETLRTRVSEIVEQLFLITHEERLETAVTGDLYKLSKKDTESGLTQVEHGSVEM
ncbi:MAG: hypothetical protein ABEI07_00070, partial [Candidatus Nanohaloarchaea archaeon]